jgi:hypothetical protein
VAVSERTAVFWNVCRVVWYISTRISEKSAAYVIRIEGPSAVLKINRAFLRNVGKHIPDDTQLTISKYSRIKHK